MKIILEKFVRSRSLRVVQSVLCILFIGITLALFWFGMTDWSEEPEPLEIESYLSDPPPGESADPNATARTPAGSGSPRKDGEKISAVRANHRTGLSEEAFLFDIQAQGQSEQLLGLHLKALDGEAFLEALTQKVTSDNGAEDLLLSPFKKSNMASREILRALHDVSLLEEEDGSPALKVLARGKTPEAARRLSDLVRQTYLEMLAADAADPDTLLVAPKLAADLRRKREQVRDLREDVYQEQRSEPASSIEIVRLRAELEDAEGRRNELVQTLEKVSRAHKEGAGLEQVAALPSISTRGRINVFLVPLGQLRRMRNSPKAANPDIREELERNIAKNEEFLRVELEATLSELKRKAAESHSERNALLAKLTALETQNTTVGRNSLRFKALKHAEEELEQLQYRHSQATAEWRKATQLLIDKAPP